VVLSDVVWIGEYADSGWLVPLKTFTDDPALADPALNLKGFFPILLESFGTWSGTLLRPASTTTPACCSKQQMHAQDAGIHKAAADLGRADDHVRPKLTHDGKYAYACSRASGRPSRRQLSCACCGRSALAAERDFSPTSRQRRRRRA